MSHCDALGNIVLWFQRLLVYAPILRELQETRHLWNLLLPATTIELEGSKERRTPYNCAQNLRKKYFSEACIKLFAVCASGSTVFVIELDFIVVDNVFATFPPLPHNFLFALGERSHVVRRRE